MSIKNNIKKFKIEFNILLLNNIVNIESVI